MSFNMLSQVDSEDNDNLDYQQILDEIKLLITTTNELLLDEYDIKINLNVFVDFLNKFNDKADVLEEYATEEEIENVYKKVKKIYETFDNKHFEILITKKGFKMLREYLENDDIYYNFYVYTKKIEYIAISLKYSSTELLKLVDEVIDSKSKYYKKQRYEQYLMILHFKLSGKRFNYDSMVKILELQEICKKDIVIEDIFNEIFGTEVVYMELYKI